MIEVSSLVGITLNVAVWFCWSAAIGYVGHRLPVRAFAEERWWSRLRAFEVGGQWYAQRLWIKHWKDFLPELGALFSGGFAKREVHRDRDHLERFVVETRRAEWVHWLGFLLWPVFAVWNPPWAVAVMVVYATLANVPSLLVQRYNRARLLHTLTRFERRARTDEVKVSAAQR